MKIRESLTCEYVMQPKFSGGQVPEKAMFQKMFGNM